MNKNIPSCCIQAAEACGSLEIDEALAAVKILEEDIREMRGAADNGQLRPFPNDNVSIFSSFHTCCSTIFNI